MSDGPAKSDIQQIFKRLRSAAPNKVCFDCGAKNPTWASITYGIFICIDCSGIHRSLGVHLTFIRSTNLDTNWSWQQLRQMQLGGNAKATTFFRSHNCTSTDTQVKYNSRAAQLYREKLHHAAAQAMRLHGTKLHIDTGNEVSNDDGDSAAKEDDFFSQEQSAANSQLFEDSAVTKPVAKSVQNGDTDKNELDTGAPNVELALAPSPAPAAPATSKPAAAKKSTLGGKKPAAKKGGLGAKKGLGATKATKNFAEIEAEAEMADKIATSRMEMKIEPEKNPEDEAKAVASMRLAYQDLSLNQQKETEKLKKNDPVKAAQLERLGMGFGGFGAGAKSHSLVSDMGEIVQEEPTNSIGSKKTSSSAVASTAAKDDFFDDFEIVDADKEDLTSWRTSRADDLGTLTSSNKNNKSAWEQDLNENVRKSSWENSNSARNKGGSSMGAATSDEATKKFANAKAISSDMFFGDQDGGDKDANLSRFQGSTAISSDMYFNRESGAMGGGGGGMSRSSSSYSYSNIQAPDMDDVKESVKQGVNKVAGRLSNMASGVMNQIQDRYGY
eukprot:TRINITY_DN4452_c0_g1_i1.p1 TRINITY_DN4452_c0_g1~~TRINITY_DN4452_c0_g1_i1.p1  ORF type:complete len:556 (+),score=154.77 TRINITY_DN4452_c0_g1_i1:43-1710(+)